MKNATSRTALTLGAAVLAGGMAAGVAGAQAQAPVTPRDAAGHPILGGLLTNGATGVTRNVEDAVTNFPGRGNNYVGLEADGALRRTSNDNWPLYKPEYWDQITDNDYNGNWEDPVDECIPLGVPRFGVPAQIIKVEGQPAYILINKAGFNGYAGSYNAWDSFRWVWADGRPHNKGYADSETQSGDAVAHWEGDTLVIESIGFTDTTWLHKNGWIHSFAMKVTERLTRIGDSLIWEATVEDPDVLQEPWKMTPIVAQYNQDPDAILGESPPCLVREPFASHVRSG